MYKVYFCVCNEDGKPPRVLEMYVGGGIHCLMDAGNRHAESIMRWEIAAPVESYYNGFQDEQLPLRAQHSVQGHRTRYVVDMVLVDETGALA